MKAANETSTPRVPDRIREIVNGWPPLDEVRRARVAALLRTTNN